jgi:hypothetical protein
LAILRGMSPVTGFDGNGDCCGVRVDLLTGGGLPIVADVGAAEEDEVEVEVGVVASLRDGGTGGPR